MTGKHVLLRIHNSSNQNAVVVFDITNGQVTQTTENGDGNVYNSGSEDWGNGLYRIWVTADVGGRLVYNTLIGLSNSGTPTLNSFGLASFAGANNDTTAVYAGFFQLEKAESSGDIPYPSSYIPTDRDWETK